MPTRVPPSGNQFIDGLLWDHKWDTLNLTYSAPANPSQYGYSIGGFAPMNPTQLTAIARTAAMFDDVCGLELTAVGPNTFANLRFAEADAIDYDGAGSQYQPMTIPTAIGTPPDPQEFPDYAHGDMFFNHTSYNNPLVGTFDFATFMHETGHALGLKHGHLQQQAYGALPFDFDSNEYSVMTYRNHVGDDFNEGNEIEAGGNPQSLMMFDIAALQYMYGADFTTNRTATTYQWSATTGEMFLNGQGQGAPVANRVFRTVWDGGGVDTYDFSNYGGGVTVDLRPGSYSITAANQLSDLGDGFTARGNVFNALVHDGDLRSVIENAVGGAGADSLYGNDIGNRLRGGGGGDYLFGFGGADQLFGGSRGDRFAFDEDWGLDTISDWEDRAGAETRYDGFDRIDLTGLRDENGGRMTLQDLLIKRSGADVVITLDLNRNGVTDSIDLDGDGTRDTVRITVRNATVNEFQNADFLF